MTKDKKNITQEERIQDLEDRVEQLELNSIACLSALRALVEEKTPTSAGVPVAIS